MYLNKVFLIGNLTRKPELRHTSSGKAVASFTVAVNERRGQNDETLFIKVTVWERQAENVERFLDKGSLVLVEGRLRVEEYQTREGEKRRDPVVVANQITFGPKGSGSGGGSDYSRGQSYGEPSARDEPSSYGDDARRDAPGGDYSYDEPPAAERASGENTDDDLPF